MGSLRETAPGRYRISPSPVGHLTVMGVAALVIAVLAGSSSSARDWLVMGAVPGLFIVFALVQLLLRPALVIDLPARRYTWRANAFPGAASVAGDLAADVRGIALEPKPCGQRRACTAGWSIVLLFRTAIGRIELDTDPVYEDALATAADYARRFALPLLDDQGRPRELPPVPLSPK